MSQERTPSGIREWISAQGRPRSVDSATLRFERMASQSARSLPEIYRMLDPRDPVHWAHRGRIWDYVLSLEGAQRVLDVGPGDGWPALLLAPHFREVVGIEPGPHRVAVCRENAKRMRVRKVRFEQMSAVEMRFPDQSFDAVVAATSIEQTPDPGRALGEIFRVLRPGGCLRLTYEVLDEDPEPVREAARVQAGDEGRFWIDYIVTYPRKYEQRDYLIEVVPAREKTRGQLVLWARRCAGDAFPLRDPRIERGLGTTIKAIAREEVAGMRQSRLRHLRPAQIGRTLERIGFRGVRAIVGGGRPARALAEELRRARRMGAAAPL
ncbi:MAG: methyltransferase domain-containing protein, partial [Candidatus Eisenbacteria bacterium]|nr:methyltransferase domain-containing protein [Candidatus Eisenbacteria bacterium]